MVFALNILHDVDVDYKTVVFGRFQKTESAVSVILACEAEIRPCLLARPFVGIFSVARVRKKIRLFCSLMLMLHF